MVCGGRVWGRGLVDLRFSQSCRADSPQVQVQDLQNELRGPKKAKSQTGRCWLVQIRGPQPIPELEGIDDLLY